MRLKELSFLGTRSGALRTKAIGTPKAVGVAQTRGATLRNQFLAPNRDSILAVKWWPRGSKPDTSVIGTGTLTRVRYYPVPGTDAGQIELGFHDGKPYRRYFGSVWYCVGGEDAEAA